MAQALPSRLTWAAARDDASIHSFEHPLYGTAFDKETFETMFSKVLEQLDGSTEADFVSFFFHRSPMDSAHLEFVDADAREDFLDWVQDEGCMPSVKEVHEGEDKEEKEKRKAEEAEKARVREQQRSQHAAKQAARDPAEVEATKIHVQLKSVDKIRAKAAKSGEGSKPAEKLARTLEVLERSVEQFREDFPDRIELLPEEYGGGKEAEESAEGGGAEK